MNFLTSTKQSLAAILLFGFAAGSAWAQSDHQKPAKLGANTASSATRKLKPFTAKNKTILNGKRHGVAKAPGDTLFFQNFEGPTWPADMPRVNVDGLTPANASQVTLMGNNAWVANNLANLPEPILERCAISLSWYTPAGQADDWMITPPITITPGYNLSWTSRASNPDFMDGYEVRVCTNCPPTFTAANVLSSFSQVLFTVDEDQADGFAPHEVSLASFAGQTIQIAFRNNSDDMDKLCVDDILVYRLPPIDIQAGTIFSPDNSVYDCSRANFPAVVSVSNKGSSTAYNVAVKLISSGPIADTVETIIDSLESAETDTITFETGLNMSALGTYNLVLSATATGDESPGNNGSSNTYRHDGPDNAPFSTNFDELTADSTLPNGWFETSAFLPINPTGGFGGTQSIELPVFNNLGTLGSQSTVELITSKYKGIPAGASLIFKYKLVDLNGVEYSMADGDTINVEVWKNCQLVGTPLQIAGTVHEPTTAFRKMFVPLDPFAFTATDEVSFRFFIKSAPSTNVFLMEMDDFEIGSVLANDMSVIDLQKIPFSQVKRTQLGALQFKGSVFNEGTTDLSPVYVRAEISPLNLTAGDTISSLQSGTARSFTTEPSLTIGEAGTMTVSLSASTPGVTDPNPSNNLSEFTLEVTDSTMAKDMGDHFEDVYMNYGTGSGGKRIMANAIRTTLKDTLTSVSVYIGPITADCQVKAFFANKNAAGNWVEDSSATIVTITTDMADSWVPLRFRKPTPAALQKGKPVVANTENLYGLKIRSGNPLVGFNFENATDDGSFIWLGGQWLGTQDITIGGLSGPYSLFIRANFGRPVMSSTTPMERSLEYADLVPNPASNGTNLVIGMQKESSVRISVHTLTGQVLSSQDRFAFKGINRLDVPVNGLAKGIYLVKIDANGFSTTKKLIIE